MSGIIRLLKMRNIFPTQERVWVLEKILGNHPNQILNSDLNSQLENKVSEDSLREILKELHFVGIIIKETNSEGEALYSMDYSLGEFLKK